MGIKDLYTKISSFEDGISPESKALSQCRKGCARCCYVDLSIFQIEADAIKSWFSQLSVPSRDYLKELWKSEQEGKCVFLVDEACTIYEARPLICRTQGLPLSYRDEEQILLDICPLNEEVLAVTKPYEILNLDTLNAILSSLERKDGVGQMRERVALRTLKKELSSRD